MEMEDTPTSRLYHLVLATGGYRQIQGELLDNVDMSLYCESNR
jgi:hypothetical protein